MKKRSNPNKIDCVPIQNPVAKFAHQFNKAHVFEDKSKYRRSAKHRKQEATPMALAVRAIGIASCFPVKGWVIGGMLLFCLLKFRCVFTLLIGFG